MWQAFADFEVNDDRTPKSCIVSPASVKIKGLYGPPEKSTVLVQSAIPQRDLPVECKLTCG